MSKVNELKSIASQVRRDVIRMINAVSSGHPGGSLSCTDYLVALYCDKMNHNPENFKMDAENEDAFFLSNGHISAAWYSVLARTGYFPVSELSTFRKLNTRLQGHPTTAEGLPGIRVASGSLGQGLSVAIGMAEAKKLKNDSSIVYTLHGDGELQEGQIWEAAMYASAKKIDNLISAIDYNKKQIDGPTDEVVSLGDLKAKWEAFGWIVLECDGNNMEAILSTLEKAKSECGHSKPIMILLKTIMGKGVSFMENNHKWHGTAPSEEQTKQALSEIQETLGDF